MNKRHQKLTNILSAVTLGVVYLLPIIAIVTWVFWNSFAHYAAENLPIAYDLSGLTIGQRFIGFTLGLVGALIQAYGLLGLRTTFLEAREGRSLSNKSIQGFGRFAKVTLVMVFFGIIQRAGYIALFSVSDPDHLGRLDIQFGSTELKALFVGLLLVFVAYVFAEGKQAKDENEAFL